MTPHALLGELKKQGVVLKVTDGKLCGPQHMTVKQREVVSENKVGLLLALTRVCPTCSQPIKLLERAGYWAVECALDPTHYSELLTKQAGRGLGWLAKHDENCPCQIAEDLGF